MKATFRLFPLFVISSAWDALHTVVFFLASHYDLLGCPEPRPLQWPIVSVTVSSFLQIFSYFCTYRLIYRLSLL